MEVSAWLDHDDGDVDDSHVCMYLCIYVCREVVVEVRAEEALPEPEP